MASLIEAIEIKRKMFFEFEEAPYHCLDVEVSKPTARGGQTLVRIKMRNLLTRAVFDKTFKAGEKFREPDLESVDATFLYADADGYHFMDQETFDTLTLAAAMVGDDRLLLVDNVLVQIQKYNGNADRPAVPAPRRADRHLDRTGRPRRHGERQRDQGRHARNRPARSACRSSSRKARRSRFTPRRASSRAGPEGASRESVKSDV